MPVLMSFASTAIVDSLGTKTINGKKYIEYRIKEHEGWYGIARKYGVSYSDLRLANKNVGDKISIGQVILVPVDKGKINDPKNLKNYLQADKNKTESKEVHHIVKPKETLFAIAKKYKVTKDELKKWNYLKSESLSIGDTLIVGYKKVSTNVAPEQGKQITQPVTEKTNVHGTEPAAGNPQPKTDSASSQKLTQEKNDGDSLTFIKKNDFAVNRKEMMEQGVATWIDDENINPNKYFALHRGAPVGTIMKVTNRMNKRTVFVKVVGKLPDTGDNDNIILKISKASAEKLGVRDQRFQCDLSYGVTMK